MDNICEKYLEQGRHIEKEDVRKLLGSYSHRGEVQRSYMRNALRGQVDTLARIRANQNLQPPNQEVADASVLLYLLKGNNQKADALEAVLEREASIRVYQAVESVTR